MEYIPLSTKKEGFLFVGEGWYYSKLNAVGSSERVSHTNMTMLSAEEEEEWERNCESGDIRVGFETEAMPIEVTIVAEQNDYRLMPVRENGKARYILFDRRVDVDEVLSHIEQKENMNL